MSRETAAWLNTMVLKGLTEQYKNIPGTGRAWHFDPRYQGGESNHYPAGVPIADIKRRLLDWQIEEIPIEGYRYDRITEDGVQSFTITDPTRKFLINSESGQVLDVVGSDYRTPNFGKDVLDFGADLMSHAGNEIVIHSAGLLRGGAEFWVQFRVPKMLTTAGMSYMPWLTISDSCNGKPWRIVRGNQVAVCDNTLAIVNASQFNNVAVRHTSKSYLAMLEAADIIGMITEYGEAFARAVEVLSNTAVSDAAWSKFLDVHFSPVTDPEKQKATVRKRENLTAMYLNNPMVSPWKGTALGVVQAVNTDVHFNKRQTVRSVEPEERRITSALNGVIERLDAETVSEINQVFRAMRVKQLVLA